MTYRYPYGAADSTACEPPVVQLVAPGALSEPMSSGHRGVRAARCRRAIVPVDPRGPYDIRASYTASSTPTRCSSSVPVGRPTWSRPSRAWTAGWLAWWSLRRAVPRRRAQTSAGGAEVRRQGLSTHERDGLIEWNIGLHPRRDRARGKRRCPARPSERSVGRRRPRPFGVIVVCTGRVCLADGAWGRAARW